MKVWKWVKWLLAFVLVWAWRVLLFCFIAYGLGYILGHHMIDRVERSIREDEDRAIIKRLEEKIDRLESAARAEKEAK